jgi:hypothetical protein
MMLANAAQRLASRILHALKAAGEGPPFAVLLLLLLLLVLPLLLHQERLLASDFARLSLHAKMNPN